MLIRTLLTATFVLRCQAACRPSPELEAELQNAAELSAAVADPFAALDKAAPFRAVRDHHPDDLFAHERYQDAMNEYGIEGHLRLLNKEYRALDFNHAGDPPGNLLYRYLYLRTLAGRNTPSAIQGLNELLAGNPDFAPAHRTLAEIYATEAFRDPARERLERERYLAACPDGQFTRWPPAIPEPSHLIDDAGRSLAAGATADQVVAVTIQGLRELEWRSQRLRAFDWFTLDQKRQDAQDLRAHYWDAWAIQVRAYRNARQTEKAAELLDAMNRRAALLANTSSPEYWVSLITLANLYSATGEWDRVKEKMEDMRKYLALHPDPSRNREVENLQKNMEQKVEVRLQ